jgi:hypothetical protein
MAIPPESKDRLMRFTIIAKAIIYDAERMKQFLQLMNTKDGAITAVKSIMGVIENKTQIPPDIAPLLGVNIYMLLVDVAQEITGGKPNPKIIKSVIAQIVNSIQPQAAPAPGAPAGPAMASAAPQGGLINQPAGA